MVRWFVNLQEIKGVQGRWWFADLPFACIDWLVSAAKRTLGAVKPSRGHRPELQGSDCPTTRLGGVFRNDVCPLGKWCRLCLVMLCLRHSGQTLHHGTRACYITVSEANNITFAQAKTSFIKTQKMSKETKNERVFFVSFILQKHWQLPQNVIKWWLCKANKKDGYKDGRNKKLCTTKPKKISWRKTWENIHRAFYWVSFYSWFYCWLFSCKRTRVSK